MTTQTSQTSSDTTPTSDETSHTTGAPEGTTGPTGTARPGRRAVMRAAGMLGASGVGAAALAACGGSSTPTTGSGAAASSSTGSASSTSSATSSATSSTTSAGSPTTSAGSTSSSATSAAPAAGGTAFKAADIPVGGGVINADAKVVVTQPSAGTYKAFSAVCTHQGCTVAKVADGKIACPCHSSLFDISTGAPTGGPAKTALPAKTATLSGDTVTVA